MMHVYLCPKCKKTYMISRRKQASCYVCGGYMVYCSLDFNDWVEKTETQRKEFIEGICAGKVT